MSRTVVLCHPVCIQIDKSHKNVTCSSFDQRKLCKNCQRYYKVAYNDGHLENSKTPIEGVATDPYWAGWVAAKIDEERRIPRQRDCDVKLKPFERRL